MMSPADRATGGLAADARIDGHVCLWRESPAGSQVHAAFPGEDRAYLPEHLKAILERSRFDAAVVVSAGCSEAEQQQLTDWAVAEPWLWGVVPGWCAALPGRAATRTLIEAGKLRGVWAAMPAPDGLPTPCGWKAEPCWREAQAWADAQGIALELLPLGTEMAWEGVVKAATASQGRLVLADLGGAPADFAALAAWMECMRALAGNPRVFVKLGGLYRSATRGWPVAQLTALFQFLLDTLGPERLLFSSGWPYCLPAHTWKECLARFTQALGARDQQLRERLLGANAQRAYAIAQDG